MPGGTTSVSGPTAALATHIELDLALHELLKSQILIRAGDTSRQAAPADLATHCTHSPTPKPPLHQCGPSLPTSPTASRAP